MKNLLDKITYLKSRITLSGERKHAIRSQLVERLGLQDVRGDELERQYLGKSKLASVLTLFHIKPMPIAATLAIVALLGGGTSFAAESSLPGDILYPVKVSINEEVRARLSFGTEAKARWDARRAERRLEEAARLSSHQEVKAEVHAKIEARFKEMSDRAQARIEKLEAEGKTQAAVNVAAGMEAMLQAHEKVLVNIEAGGERPRDAVRAIRQEVQSELRKAMEVRASLRIKASAEASASPSPSVSPVPTRTTSPSPNIRIDASGEGNLDLQLR